MAIWPFNRNRQANGQKVPKEVEQYYQSERRDRVGVAWLLAAGTLVITVLIVLGLFFGGRWAYRKIANKDNTSTTQTAETNKSSDQNQPSQQSDSNNGSSSSESTGSTPATTPSSSSPSASQSPANQGTVNAPTQTNTPSSVPSQPTQTSNLANTGPGETVAIFVFVSIAGYLGYSAYLKRKLN